MLKTGLLISIASINKFAITFKKENGILANRVYIGDNKNVISDYLKQFVIFCANDIVAIILRNKRNARQSKHKSTFSEKQNNIIGTKI